jgi:ferredoxin
MKKQQTTVDKTRCPQNHVCPMIKLCPVGAISQIDFSAPLFDQAKCISCGRCVENCPMGAIAIN